MLFGCSVTNHRPVGLNVCFRQLNAETVLAIFYNMMDDGQKVEIDQKHFQKKNVLEVLYEELKATA